VPTCSAGAKAVGYQEVRRAINSAERDGGPGCQQSSFCFQGCAYGAKWSSLYAGIPKGEETGKLEVRPNSYVLSFEHNDSGR